MKNESSRALVSRAFAVVAFRVAGIALMLVVQMLIARCLGVAKYGEFVATFGLAQVASALAIFGLHHIGVREIACSGSAELSRSIGVVTRLFLMAVIVVSVLAAASAGWILPGVDRWGLVSLLILLAMIQFAAVILNGLHQTGVAGLCVGPGGGPLGLACVLLWLVPSLLLRSSMNVDHAIWLFVLGLASAIPIAGYLCSRAYATADAPAANAGSSGFPTTRVLFCSCLLIALSDLATLFIAYGTPLVVGRYVSSEDLSIFVAASRIAALGLIPLHAFNLSARPVIARCLSHRDTDGLSRQLGTCAAGAILPALGVLVGIACLGRVVFPLVFGDPVYSASTGPAVILAAGYVLRTLIGCPEVPLVQGGYEKSVLAINVAMSLIVVLGCIVATRSLGIVGAAFICATANLLAGGLLWLRLKQALDVGSHLNIPLEWSRLRKSNDPA